jgi:formate-dependent nitrite reductase membrane component NrfD
MSKLPHEREMFAKFDILLIAIELFLIIHMFMGFRAGGQVQIEVSQMFLGGDFTAVFWTFVVGLGLVVPAILEIMEMKHIKVPYFIAPILVIFGGMLFRFIMVHAGQLSRWLY